MATTTNVIVTVDSEDFDGIADAALSKLIGWHPVVHQSEFGKRVGITVTVPTDRIPLAVRVVAVRVTAMLALPIYAIDALPTDEFDRRA